MTEHTSKNLTPRQRLEGLKALLRHKANEGKILTGRVSERKTALTHLIKADIPPSFAECKQRLLDLQGKWEEIEKAKEEKSNFARKQKEAEYQLLFEDIHDGAQLQIDGTDVEITRETVELVKAAIVTVRQEEESRGEEDGPTVPEPDTVALDSLAETLEEWLSAEGLAKTQLASEAQATHPDDAKRLPPKRGRKPKNKPEPKVEAANEEDEPEEDPDDDAPLAAAGHARAATLN